MIYRIIFLCVIGTIVSNCSAGFNNLFTVGGISTAVASKNAYSIGYNAVDLGVQIQSGKPIRVHIIDNIKEEDK
tara:strand:+ start:1249 stop:1470 length:222 start_codon:yes stop_codon:yes gene_type:complete